MKGISLLKFKYVDRNVLDLSYKMYVRPHLDYGDVIYHNQRAGLMDLIERVLKVAPIVSGCWQGTSREKLYEELGWESLSDRRWARRLTILYKINSGHAPLYLSDRIPKRNEMRLNLRNRTDNTPLIRTERYENSCCPCTIKEWKKLNEESISKSSVPSFKKHLNEFIRPPGHSLFGIRDKFGTYLLTKIRVSFSDLRDHRFNHNFKCESPICSCGFEDETSVHFFLRCSRYATQRTTPLSKISDIIGSDVSIFPGEHLYDILVNGRNVYNNISNGLIITETIIFIRNSGRFTKLEAFGWIFLPHPNASHIFIFTFVIIAFLSYFCHILFVFYSQSTLGEAHEGICVGWGISLVFLTL